MRGDFVNAKIFLNLPVKSLEVTREFYEKLGFKIDPNVTDEKSIGIVISEDIYIMFLKESFFKSFTKKEIPDFKNMAQCIVSLKVDSQLVVDTIVDRAVEVGAIENDYAGDVSSMYIRSFSDPAGHMFEIFSR